MQCSISLEEASAVERWLIDPNLPFGGDTSTFIRTMLRAGLQRLHEEREVSEDAFIQSMRPIIGSELLKWSAGYCDSFAVAATDHLAMAIDSGDERMAAEVVSQIVDTLSEVTNKSAKSMLKRALMKRGFVHAIERLRQMLLDMLEDVYDLDSLVAEQFT